MVPLEKAEYTDQSIEYMIYLWANVGIVIRHKLKLIFHVNLKRKPANTLIHVFDASVSCNKKQFMKLLQIQKKNFIIPNPWKFYFADCNNQNLTIASKVHKQLIFFGTKSEFKNNSFSAGLTKDE